MVEGFDLTEVLKKLAEFSFSRIVLQFPDDLLHICKIASCFDNRFLCLLQAPIFIAKL
jgi:diphthamide synthase subunit DPH2